MKAIYVYNQSIQSACAVLTPKVRLFADSAVIAHRRQPLFIPDCASAWQSNIMCAVRISRLGKDIAPEFAQRYYDSISLVNVLLPADTKLVEDTDAFRLIDSSIVHGDWLPVTADTFTVSAADQSITTDIASLDVDNKISQISRFATLKTGDIIIFDDVKIPVDTTGDSVVCALINNTECLKFKIK